MLQYFRDLLIRKKIFILLLLLTVVISSAISGTMYIVSSSLLFDSLQLRLKHVAITTALAVDGDLVSQIQSEADRKGAAYAALEERLRRIRDENGLKHVYVMRRGRDAGVSEFVVDPGAREEDRVVGKEYALSQAPRMAEGFQRASVDADIVVDQTEATLSGYAPIRRRDGSVVGIVGVDMDASDVIASRRRFREIAVGLFVAFIVLSLALSIVFARILTRPILEMTDHIQGVTSGDLNRRMKVRGRDELGRLSGAINRMLDTLGHYLPVKLAEKILSGTGTLSLGGVRAPVTVYFSDLAGFTTVSERLPAEKLVALLNEYLTVMSDIIEESGGTVDKYEGDAIMAFWGAPVSQEDHAHRACEAVLRQVDALARLREEWKRRGDPDVSFRVGLNSGEVVVGNMGSLRRFNYTAMGDVVNLASRLEGANKAYGSTILMAEATVRMIQGHYECRLLDRLRVKGKTIAVPVYELLGRKGEVASEILEAREFFQGGLEAYFVRRWDEAERCIHRAADLRPGDPAAEAVLERIREMRKQEPSEDWDGAYEMTTK